MNRRSFLASILASATAPYVSTAAGVLMPVKKLVAPDYSWWRSPPISAYNAGDTIFFNDRFFRATTSGTFNVELQTPNEWVPLSPNQSTGHGA